MNILKNPVIISVFAGVIVGVCLLGLVMPQTTNADFANIKDASYVAKNTNPAVQAVRTIKVVITAYSKNQL